MTEDQLRDVYSDMLDAVYGVVIICGLPYTSSRALRGVDPLMYERQFDAWLSDNYCIVVDTLSSDLIVYVKKERNT